MTDHSAAETDFYKGKEIKILVGARPGVAYDIYARLIGRHAEKHIPGTPRIIVENVTGARSLVVANQVYGAEPDGFTLGAISPDLYFSQLLGRKEVHFDWSRFAWIGTPDRSHHLLYMRTDTPYTSIAAIASHGGAPKCGASGAYSTAGLLPKVLEKIFGARFTMVAGFDEGPDVDRAVERGDIQCRVLTISGFFSHEPYPTWLKNGFIRILLQTGRERDPRLPEAPTIYELMDQHDVDVTSRGLTDVVLSAALFGRPLVAPPRTPLERVAILREAFLRAVNDPDLLEEAERKNLLVVPASGAELENLAREVTAQTPQIVGQLRKLSQM
jgi:tripartite-type tricarboxylate transporter receptor subunit TctC